MTPCRILIVDDDDSVTGVLHTWFEDHNGCPTATVQDSDEALDILTWNKFDVVITGINQIGMSGIELTREIRRLGGPPVIILTGYATDANQKAAMQAGAAVFMKKPVGLEVLSVIVSQVVGKID